MRLLSVAPARSRGRDGESPVPAAQVRVRGWWGPGWGMRAFPEPEESGRVGQGSGRLGSERV